jgi:hypothetical protein
MWKIHVQNICGKALKNPVFIRHLVGRSSNEKVNGVTSLWLGHTSNMPLAFWGPEQKYLIKELDKIQRKAARFVKNCYGRTEIVPKIFGGIKMGTITDSEAARKT